MHKLWLIARREYLKVIRAKGFVVLTLGLPALILAGLVLAVFLANRGPTEVGFVDQAGVIQELAPAVTTAGGETVGPDQDKVRFTAYSETQAGRAALGRQEIETLFVLPAEYLETGRVDAVYRGDAPSGRALEQFKLLLKANLASGQPPEVVARVLQGPDAPTLSSLDGRTPAGGYGLGSVIIPGIVAVFFTMALMSAASYLLQAVSEEKENRTVEVLATSVSANQLIGGKTAGLVAAALTQLAVWGAGALAGLLLALHYFPLAGGLHVSASFAGLALLYFVPSFILAAGLIIAIGAAVGDFQQGQQISGVLSMLFMLPVFFVALMFQDPDSPILVFLSLFPTSSLATVLFRWGLTVIPFWQLALGWVFLALTAGAGVVFAPRVFRLGMLRYGKRMNLRGLVRAARSSEV